MHLKKMLMMSMEKYSDKSKVKEVLDLNPYTLLIKAKKVTGEGK